MARDTQTVLVIDDDSDARDALTSLLTDAGFEVVEARDGEAAVNYLTSKSKPPALIVTDLAMPDMTGWEFINVLHASIRLSAIPLLVVSGAQLHDQPVRQEGVLEFFPKPLDAAEFLAAVHRHATSAAQREARRHAATEKVAQPRF